MRFELAVALKYLIPKWRHLSVSIISLISVLVVSLVVWLVVLFLSVTAGIEKKWIQELVALNSPVRMTPTEEYYKSYYYQIDGLSLNSGYSTKTIGEKLIATQTDPYDPQLDAQLPPDLPPSENKDLVKEGYAAIQSLTFAGLQPQESEVSFGNLRLQMVREDQNTGEVNQTFVTQVCYVAAHDGSPRGVSKMVLPPSPEDFVNLHAAVAGASSEELEKLCVYPPSESLARHIPTATLLGEGVLVAKHFQNNGVLIGDRGYLAYYAPSGTGMQEQRVPIYVAGFYDPGMMPVGNKLIFVDHEVSALFRSNTAVADPMLGNGINIWIDNLSDAAALKKALTASLEARGLGKYWKVESYEDYEFTRPILEQLQSDKNLFTLIAVIILIVACSNIISMLILLVNDKKREIGIMQALGASPGRIAVIFGLCGFVTGLVSCIVGTCAAILTLSNLQSLVNVLSFLQGRDAFQAVFYGSQLPSDVSYEALVFVSVATLVISLLAGIIPAIKASKIRPCEILRSEG